ncbi:MAG: zinc ribbon domain-containing protein [Actinobacteria bacterium]|nr:zinc ribbon domain-containing protein [Actinomycetota bacterium]
MSHVEEKAGGGRSCPRCGKEARGGASFCTACGADLREGGEGPSAKAEVGMVAAPHAGEGEAAHPRPPGAEPAAAPPGMAPVASRRKRLALLLGIVGGILLVGGGVLLALYLVLWRGGAGAGDPVALARKYMRAMEDKDFDALKECYDPDYLAAADQGLLEDMGLGPGGVVEWMMSFLEVRFSAVELRVEHEDAHDALVVTTAGRLSYSIMGWSQEFDLAEEPLRFRMNREEGRWYLVEDPVNQLLQENLGPEGDTGFFEDQDLREFWEEFMKDFHLDGRMRRDLEELWREMEEWLEEGEEGSATEVSI